MMTIWKKNLQILPINCAEKAAPANTKLNNKILKMLNTSFALVVPLNAADPKIAKIIMVLDTLTYILWLRMIKILLLRIYSIIHQQDLNI